MKKKILLGLTTTPKSDWRGKVKEIQKYNIKEIALFPTFLKIKDRETLYKLLEKTCLEKIPHVHLRDDMETWELDYFFKKYKTRLFNVHSRKEDLELVEKNEKYRKNIFVENSSQVDKAFFDLAKACGGFCFDVSHYQDFAINQKDEYYRSFLISKKNIPIGCCHISAIANKYDLVRSLRTGKLVKSYSVHYLAKLKELDYVRNYTKYLPKIISIELENSFEEQLKIKEYLEKIIL